jgi:energy-coupling factor transport system ATP-binding protein
VNHALVLERVTFSYPKAERPALVDADVSIPEGSFALVLGRTGAGKSTLLRTANGLVPHFSGGSFSGRVTVEGRDTLELSPRKLADVVAFVPQDPDASFVLERVEDEIAYGMENLRFPPPRMRRRVEEVLDLLTIEPLRERSVRSLSGGERQRVAIAAALATGPRVLVLDEPTSQLDPQGAEDVLAALQRLVHDHGITVILAEHRLERVAGFVDLALGCREGHVVSGPPAEVIEALGTGPPVARLGRLVGWSPPPLTVREARARIGGGPRAVAPTPAGVSAEAATGEPRPAPRVRARRLEAGYEGGSVLRGVDLEVGPGGLVALMGRNGAGKTTLLRCLAGLLEPTSGEVLVSGSPPAPGRSVAICPQEPESILFCDSVSAEVGATLRARRRPTSRVDDLLRGFGISELGSRHPRDCSAGQRLLTATAAVVATGAPVLFLDEPTRGLDAETKQRLAEFLRVFAAEGNTVIFATHDVELSAALARRVVLLAGGEVIADGSPQDVLGDSSVFAPQMTRVFGPGWLTPEEVAAALVAV